MSTLPGNKARYVDASPLAYGLVLAGTALIVGGESLCFFGPETHARLRDVVCHIIFYCGAVSVLAGVALGIKRRR